MNPLEQLLERLSEIRQEMEEIAAVEERSEEQDARFAELEHELEHEDQGETRGLLAEIEREKRRVDLAGRVAEAEETGARAVEEGDERGSFNSLRKPDVYEVAERHDATVAEIRDAALRVIDERVGEPSQQENAERLVRRNHRGDIARHVVRYANPVYERAWAKTMAGQAMLLDAEEQRQIQVGLTTQGGFLVPTHLDPTVLLTGDGEINPFRSISRVVVLGPADGNEWNGVTSAGVTATFASEGTEVGDDSPTFGGPSIPVHKAHAFVQASFEAFTDITGLAGDVAMMLGEAKGDLESEKFAVGTTADIEPTGIFTRLEQTAASQVQVTTQGEFSAGDVYKLRRQLPPRWRGRASWLSELSVNDEIRQLGGDEPNFTIDFTSEGVEILLGRRYVEASDAPEFTQQSTTTNSLLIYGDFRDFLIADKVGMSTEFIPQLFGTTNARPVGRRGWYAHWRTGSDAVRNEAFRLLVDQSGS